MRKPKLTYEMVERAVELKGDGLSDVDIIAALGVHHSTFYRWLKDPNTRAKRALKDGLKKAEADYKRTLLTTVRKAALEKSGHWTAAAWLLERKYPEEYGKAERKLDDGKAEAAPQIVLGVTVARAAGDACAPDAGGLEPGTAGRLADGGADA